MVNAGIRAGQDSYPTGLETSPKSSTSKGHGRGWINRVQRRSAAARQHLADRSQPLASRPKPQRPSATLMPPATDQKAGGSNPSERARSQASCRDNRGSCNRIVPDLPVRLPGRSRHKTSQRPPIKSATSRSRLDRAGRSDPGQHRVPVLEGPDHALRPPGNRLAGLLGCSHLQSSFCLVADRDRPAATSVPDCAANVCHLADRTGVNGPT